MAEMMTVNYRLLDKFEEISWTNATLVEPLAVAYNTVLNARIPLGGDVVVMGPGPIGLMCVRLAGMRGAGRVILIGTTAKSARGKKRLEAGLELSADSVIVTSPPLTLPLAIRCARFGGTVSFIGINLGGMSKIELDVNELIFNKVTLTPTFAEPAQNFPDTIGILRNNLMEASKLITTTFSFSEAEMTFRKSDSGEAPIIKAVFVPG